jgi:DsbC/DsbD-like thiol-disulfide interchange protein
MPPRSALAIATSLIVCAGALPVRAEDGPSPWSPAHGAAIRLVPGGTLGDGRREAGIDIRLDKGWKTYWRDPGDAGVPPVFDWSRSQNVAKVDVAFPAPQRIEDEGGSSIGYKHDVLLPVSITPKNPFEPVELELGIDYAVCETICVPAHGEARLRLGPGDQGDAASREAINAAQAAVPKTSTIGADGPLGIASIAVDKATAPPTLVVSVKSRGDSALFVEGGTDWYLPAPVPAGPGHYQVKLEGLPKSATLAGRTLRLTLVGPDGAIEALYTLP